jgi:ABC-2 type transport system permease protein
VRREIWENRSIYVAPAITAGIVLLGLLISAINVPSSVLHQVNTLAASDRQMAFQATLDGAAAIIMVASFVVGFFYCLGALYGERRDRTILFWKSLPVSDLTTVAAKAAIPLVVLPLVTFLVIAFTQLIMLAASLVFLPAAGMPATLLIEEFPLLSTWANLFVVLACLSLWYAPIWGWNFLISGWARRVTFLWSVGPPIGLAVFEQLAFHTKYVNALIGYRLTGGLGELLDADLAAHSGRMTMTAGHIDLAKFFSTPGLWVGLAFAAAFFTAVVWQRRYRSPL